jgi:hypothetical protein
MIRKTANSDNGRAQLIAIGSRPERSLRPRQLRQLQVLWHRWTRRLGLTRAADRELRHYFVWLFSSGRAATTLELSEPDAQAVIAWLVRLVRRAEARSNYAAGTAGRRGYPEQRRVRPTAFAWRTLWACAAALGMQRRDLDRFIGAHYSKIGLHALDDLHTMADLNRVLWGLKEILRRKARADPAVHDYPRAA